MRLTCTPLSQGLSDGVASVAAGMGGAPGSGGGAAGVAAAAVSHSTAAAVAASMPGIDGPALPVLPPDVIAEAVPGNIRNAELFVQFMRHVVRFLRVRAQLWRLLILTSDDPLRAFVFPTCRTGIH
jgi:hypothetical protein